MINRSNLLESAAKYVRDRQRILEMQLRDSLTHKYRSIISGSNREENIIYFTFFSKLLASRAIATSLQMDVLALLEQKDHLLSELDERNAQLISNHDALLTSSREKASIVNVNKKNPSTAFRSNISDIESNATENHDIDFDSPQVPLYGDNRRNSRSQREKFLHDPIDKDEIIANESLYIEDDEYGLHSESLCPISDTAIVRPDLNLQQKDMYSRFDYDCMVTSLQSELKFTLKEKLELVVRLRDQIQENDEMKQYVSDLEAELERNQTVLDARSVDNHIMNQDDRRVLVQLQQENDVLRRRNEEMSSMWSKSVEEIRTMVARVSDLQRQSYCAYCSRVGCSTARLILIELLDYRLKYKKSEIVAIL